MTGTPEGSTESGFKEKQGIEPATPGLQGIGLSPTPQRPPYQLYWYKVQSQDCPIRLRYMKNMEINVCVFNRTDY